MIKISANFYTNIVSEKLPDNFLYNKLLNK
jgi:hypothetical protein